MSTKPVLLLITSEVREVDPEQWARMCERFEILTYDCASTEEFRTRLAPGGAYSQIQAIVRTGWLKAGRFASHVLFRGEILKHYPPTLKIIACSGHGYDAADVDTLTEMGIWYCNSPDTCTEAVANTALYLILGTFRYFTFAEHCARNDQWVRSRELGTVAIDPSGQILGIIGLGDIGVAIAVRASVLGMKIHYHNRTRNEVAERSLPQGATYHNSLSSLLGIADCIVLACPYTAKTHHMLSSAQFALAKDSGLRVVNIARGGLIDEEALLEAMAARKVVGVGLDVHEAEPMVNPALKDNYMVTLLPHIGVCSRTSWLNFDKCCLENVEKFFYGGESRPTSSVNFIK
jgi:glyoxylate reductase